MAYLHINGYQVKVREGGGLKHDETFARRRYSPNGNYQFGRNHVGRAWSFTTIPMPQDDVIALSAMLNMRGDHWAFDMPAANRPIVLGATPGPFYSDKKRAAYNASGIGNDPVAQVESCFGADGALVYDKNGVADRPWAGATGYVRCEPSCTNLLTANEADPESGALGWTATTTATVTADTDRKWRSSGCAKVAWTADNSGAVSSARGVDTSSRYVFSVYVRPDAGGEQVDIEVEGDNSGVSAGTSYTLPAGTDTWTRIEHAYTTDGSDTTLTCYVRGQGSSGTVYIDGAQLEKQATGPATGWLAGTTSRVTGNLQYDNLLTGFTQGITVSWWGKFLRSGTGGSLAVWSAGASANGQTVIAFYTSSDNLVVSSRAPDEGSFSEFVVQKSSPDAAWHHYVYTFDGETPKAALYEDGALIQSDTTLSGNRLFDPSGMTGDFHIGNASYTGIIGPGPITHLTTFPFAASADFVSKLYNSAAGAGGGSPGLTPLMASGTFLGTGEANVEVYGRVDGVANVPHFSPVTSQWEAGGGQITFTLFEAAGR